MRENKILFEKMKAVAQRVPTDRSRSPRFRDMTKDMSVRLAQRN